MIHKLVLLCLFILPSCTTQNQDTIFSDLPSYMPSPAAPPLQNHTTKEGVLLGKQLFFEKKLSKNNSISCATCHQPHLYFTDGLKVSNLGTTGKNLQRHTPTLLNVAYSKNGLFWDGSIKNLESLPAAPLQHPDEMAMNLKKLPLKLQEEKNYPELFRGAFGTDSITNALIFRALAQYQRTLLSPSNDFMTRWDSVKQNKVVFTALEKKGEVIFQKNCSSCHPAPLFSDYEFHFAHLDTTKNNFEKELGRQRVTENPTDYLKFKTPTLRFISKTAPYLHNGATEELNYFLEGEKAKTLTEQEKQALLAFLKCL